MAYTCNYQWKQHPNCLKLISIIQNPKLFQIVQNFYDSVPLKSQAGRSTLAHETASIAEVGLDVLLVKE
jgi:hypothetical protein